jgi:DNA helicase HerA-like ATPase
MIKNGKINVVSLIELTEKQANIAVSFYLQELLDDRKKAKGKKIGARNGSRTEPRFPAPVLVVLEEAHVFIPKDEKTETKYFASKVAREGRKFGLGLVIVSQRPRAIDANILSQMGSFAIMRMIQPDDQAQISAASESLSRDLMEQLASLNPGEAILTGQWVNLPTFAKVDEIKEHWKRPERGGGMAKAIRHKAADKRNCRLVRSSGLHPGLALGPARNADLAHI